MARSERAVELGVFLFMIVPSMLLSYFATSPQQSSFPLLAVAIILRDLALVALVAFFLWRNGEPWSQLGWTARGAARELLLGIGLFLPMALGMAAVESILKSIGLSASAPPASLLPSRTYAELLLATVLALIVAIAEETLFRGYLMLRFGNLLRKPSAAVLLSAGVFALGHGYEGTAGVGAIAFVGIVLALVYRWRRSLVAPITMHFLQDFMSMVLAPLLLRGHHA